MAARRSAKAKRDPKPRKKTNPRRRAKKQPTFDDLFNRSAERDFDSVGFDDDLPGSADAFPLDELDERSHGADFLWEDYADGWTDFD